MCTRLIASSPRFISPLLSSPPASTDVHPCDPPIVCRMYLLPYPTGGLDEDGCEEDGDDAVRLGDKSHLDMLTANVALDFFSLSAAALTTGGLSTSHGGAIDSVLMDEDDDGDGLRVDAEMSDSDDELNPDAKGKESRGGGGGGVRNGGARQKASAGDASVETLWRPRSTFGLQNLEELNPRAILIEVEEAIRLQQWGAATVFYLRLSDAAPQVAIFGLLK